MTPRKYMKKATTTLNNTEMTPPTYMKKDLQTKVDDQGAEDQHNEHDPTKSTKAPRKDDAAQVHEEGHNNKLVDDHKRADDHGVIDHHKDQRPRPQIANQDTMQK
jgi:hypothetical protein